MKNPNIRTQIWILIGVLALFLILLVLFVDLTAVFNLLRRVDWLIFQNPVTTLL